MNIFETALYALRRAAKSPDFVVCVTCGRSPDQVTIEDVSYFDGGRTVQVIAWCLHGKNPNHVAPSIRGVHREVAVFTEDELMNHAPKWRDRLRFFRRNFAEHHRAGDPAVAQRTKTLYDLKRRRRSR